MNNMQELKSQNYIVTQNIQQMNQYKSFVMFSFTSPSAAVQLLKQANCNFL